MTPAEKAKLYTAIGYSEVAVNHNLPKNVSGYCIFPTHCSAVQQSLVSSKRDIWI